MCRVPIAGAVCIVHFFGCANHLFVRVWFRRQSVSKISLGAVRTCWDAKVTNSPIIIVCSCFVLMSVRFFSYFYLLFLYFCLCSVVPHCCRYFFYSVHHEIQTLVFGHNLYKRLISYWPLPCEWLQPLSIHCKVECKSMKSNKWCWICNANAAFMSSNQFKSTELHE